MNIAIVSGSTRKGRASHRVALALEKKLITKGQAVSIIDLMDVELQHFVERFADMENKPEKLQNASEILQNANAIIFLTPEYNGTITSALKNFIDLFGKKEFAAKPIGVSTASTGVMGGVRAAYQLQQIILALQAYPQPQMLLAAEVTKQLNEQGDIINPVFENKIEVFTSSLLNFTNRFL